MKARNSALFFSYKEKKKLNYNQLRPKQITPPKVAAEINHQSDKYGSKFQKKSIKSPKVY